MTNHVTTLKQWLKTSNCVLVPDDWLEACVEWIQEENQGSSLQLDDLKKQVYEQWLMSDLRELKTPSFPSELTSNRKIEINGFFAVQIDSAKDIGCSFYSQVQKLKGTENPNALVSGEEPKQPSWEPKPTRIILLEVTDGVTDVMAMEYKPTAALTPFMTPGTKMLIKGPVLCRLGMLMLGPSNIQILGGEVDSLMETNTPETVLATAMQQSQDNSGKSERQEFSGRMLTKGDDKKVFAAPSQPPQGPGVNKQEHIKREPVSWNSQNAMGDSRQIGKHAHHSQIKQETSDPDWEDDFDYDALMADMEEETPQQVPRGHNSERLIKTEAVSQQQVFPQHSRTLNQPVAVKINDEDFMDDFDDDFDVQTSFSKSTQRQIKVEPRSQPSQIRGTAGNFINKSKPTPEARLTGDRVGFAQSSVSNSSSAVGPSYHDNMGRNNSEQFDNSKPHQHLGKVFTSQSIKVKNSQISNAGRPFSSGDGGSSHVDMAEFDEDFDMEDFDSIQTPERHPGPAKRFKAEPSESDHHRNRSCIQTDRSHSSKSESDVVYTCIKGDVPKAVIHPFQGTNNDQGKTDSVQGHVMKNSGSGQRQRGQSRMDRFLGGSVSNTTPSPSRGVKPSGETFTYLSSVLRNMPVAEPKEIVIKGYISTLTSKLTSCQGKEWSLSCKINDGTGAINVDLANSVLTKLIGFSAEDSVVMKHRAKFDPTVKDVLAEGLQQCQQSLTDLSSLMKIQFLPGESKPVLIQIVPITAHHVHSLYERIVKKYPPDR